MHRFEHPQTVLLPAHLRLKAQAYAVAVRGTVNYADSGQVSPKVRGDHLTGKLGEEAVRLVYQSFGVAVDGPDYQIHSRAKKSWAADLTVEDTALHVKTQTLKAALLYGLSWMFQDAATRSDATLTQPDDWVAFVLLNEDNLQARVFPPQQISDLRFAEPMLEHLRGKKQVAYAREQHWFRQEWAAL